MIFRLITLVVALVSIAIFVLAIRQQRLATARIVSESHNAVDRMRQETRSLMTPIAAQTTPETVRAACRRAKLQLEPVDAVGQAPIDPPAAKGTDKPRTEGAAR